MENHSMERMEKIAFILGSIMFIISVSYMLGNSV